MTTTVKNNGGEKRKKMTARRIRLKKKRGEVITMLTAYDYPTALAIDKAEIDSILVGDSLGMVVLGYENTLPVTMEDMLHHCKAVSRGAKNPLLVGDMPFMSYQSDIWTAVENAGRFLQEAGMDAVKLEGGKERADAIEQMVLAGIPVMGHIGLTPQSVNTMGGFRAQGKKADQAKSILEDALILEEAGVFGIVLEAVPAQLAELISRKLQIPTIGIGAGVGCDGQVLVTHDLVGQFDKFTPKFVKQYANIHNVIQEAMIAFRQDVSQKGFPAEEHSIFMKKEEWDALMAELDK